jgi:hypothetical protein
MASGGIVEDKGDAARGPTVRPARASRPGAFPAVPDGPAGADAAGPEPGTGDRSPALATWIGDFPPAAEPQSADHHEGAATGADSWRRSAEPWGDADPAAARHLDDPYPATAESRAVLYPAASEARPSFYPGAVEPRPGSARAAPIVDGAGREERSADLATPAERAGARRRDLSASAAAASRARPADIAPGSYPTPRLIESGSGDPGGGSRPLSRGSHPPAAIAPVSRPAARIDPPRLDDSGTFLAEAAWRNGVDSE